MALVSASTAAKMGEDEAMTMSNPPSSSATASDWRATSATARVPGLTVR